MKIMEGGWQTVTVDGGRGVDDDDDACRTMQLRWNICNEVDDLVDLTPIFK